MTIQNVVLPLPESLYLRLQQTAQATRQSLTDVLLHAVQVGSPPNWEESPAMFQADLAALDRLDDESLWHVVRQHRQFHQRHVHLLRRAFEQASAAAGEQRIAAEQHAAAVKGDVRARMPGNFEY